MKEEDLGDRQRRRLEQHVSRFAAEELLLAPNSNVLVGVSGGPDSTALLLILARLASLHSIHLTAAYFDHKLRGGEAAAAECDAVSRLADKTGVPLVRGEADVRLLARERRLSIEQAARVARYEFLAGAARS